MAQRFKTPITIEGATAASSQAVAANVDGDIQNRVQIDAGGKITWGDGSTAGDTNLYRDAANALKTDDTLEAASGLITLTTTGAPTASLADGAIAIDTTNDELYIRSGGAWVKQGGGGAAQSDTAPSNPVAGDLWYETDTGAMYVYYDSAWIEVGTAGVIAMQTSSTPPTTPGNGDLWFDTDTAKTYLYYDDGSSAQWVEVGAASAAASGTDGSVQFSTGGTFDSSANLVWDDANSELEVTGSVIVSGTVDGRDVSADGSKLDGIEPGATADQTASEILTAIKTVDGAGSGLDADTLDGTQGSDYALKTYVDTAVSNLVDAAPATLDTLNELAAALGDDANFATTVTNSIATKQDSATALTTSTSFGGDVSGTYNSIVVANDSHTHDASNLTGNTLASGVTASSLTSVGTLSSLAVSGNVTVDGTLSSGGEPVVTSDDISTIVKLTQAEYDALTPDANTLYVIVG